MAWSNYSGGRRKRKYVNEGVVYGSRRNKYGSSTCTVDGIVFDSQREAKRYIDLHLLEINGKISNLQMQVKYVLIPTQREPDTIGARGGVKKGKVIEKECAYVADFVYFDNEKQQTVVEDTKGFRTKDYVIKRKLMLHVHGIRISEI